MATSVSIFDDLAAAGRDAGDRLGRGAQPCLFDRLDWFRLVQEHTPEGEPLVIKVKNGVASCWLFLSARGGYAEGLTNWYCLRYAPVLDGPAEKAPVGDFVKGLRQAGISHVYLSPVAGDDRIAEEFRRRGWATARGQVNVSWRIDTRGMSFDRYWEGRPSRLRNTVNRRAKKANLETRILDRFDEAAWADYEIVYNNSWKPNEGSPALIRKLAEQEGAAGTLRLGLAYHEGKPVASQLWLVEHGIATIHKLAYREDARELSPGSILSRDMFRHALDIDHVDLIDFGIGNDAYKAEWMTHCVPLYGVTAYDLLRPAGLFGAARAAARKAFGRFFPAQEAGDGRFGGRARPAPAGA